MSEVKLTGLKDVVAWLECQPQWSGVAVRRVDEPPIPGEPFISMESAKHLIVSAVSIMDNHRFDTEDGLVKRLKQHKPYNEIVDGPLVREAAARIEALEEALKPIAELFADAEGRLTPDYGEVSGRDFQMMTMHPDPEGLASDLRRAARAYANKGEPT